MKTRVLLPELMDDPELDPAEHFRALRGLQRINTWTRNAALAWGPIAKLAKSLREDSSEGSALRVLDVATGAGDIPIGLWKRAKVHGIDIVLDACDISATALEFATTNCARRQAPVRLFQHDILAADIPETYDVVICSQFLHHLTNEQASHALATMAAAASRRVIAIDLVRSRRNWLQVWFATRILSRSKVVHFDGPQSIRAAFTVDELRAMAEACNFESLSIRTRWPCRMILIGVVRGHE